MYAPCPVLQHWIPQGVCCTNTTMPNAHLVNTGPVHIFVVYRGTASGCQGAASSCADGGVEEGVCAT